MKQTSLHSREIREQQANDCCIFSDIAKLFDGHKAVTTRSPHYAKLRQLRGFRKIRKEEKPFTLLLPRYCVASRFLVANVKQRWFKDKAKMEKMCSRSQLHSRETSCCQHVRVLLTSTAKKERLSTLTRSEISITGTAPLTPT